MVFSDTTNKNGILQSIERWTATGDAGVTGNATLLKTMTAEVNEAYDELMPHFLRHLKTLGFDDTNNSGIPTKLVNIVSGTSTYTAAQDTNSLDIFNILDVAILKTSSATDYELLEKITADDPDAPFYLSPNASATGVPSKVLITGNKIFFDRIPNYNATNGIKIFATRQQDRFVSTDTTAEPGFPELFHPLLVWIPSLNYRLQKKPEETAVILQLNAKIEKMKLQLEAFTDSRHATKGNIAAAYQNNK